MAFQGDDSLGIWGKFLPVLSGTDRALTVRWVLG